MLDSQSRPSNSPSPLMAEVLKIAQSRLFMLGRPRPSATDASSRAPGRSCRHKAEPRSDLKQPLVKSLQTYDKPTLSMLLGFTLDATLSSGQHHDQALLQASVEQTNKQSGRSQLSRPFGLKAGLWSCRRPTYCRFAHLLISIH